MTISTCSVDKCGKPVSCKGFCKRHYQQDYNGLPLTLIAYVCEYEHCHNSIENPVSNRKFCSRACQYRATHRSSTLNATRSCSWCETEFTSDNLNVKLCSEECKRMSKLLGEVNRKYGITKEQYRKMYIAQGGVCALCGEFETMVRSGIKLILSVDHCHDTGKVRGLLCSRCNRGIGMLGDDPLILKKAIEYLETRR